MPLQPYLTNPFIQHTLLELPASLQFLVLPSRQLSQPAPQAHALIRQYGLLLFCTVLGASSIGLLDVRTGINNYILAGSELSWLKPRAAFALGLYHAGPIIRSSARLVDAITTGRAWTWRDREAVLYVLLHLIVGGGLMRRAWEGWC
jgi:hypothetical protein